MHYWDKVGLVPSAVHAVNEGLSHVTDPISGFHQHDLKVLSYKGGWFFLNLLVCSLHFVQLASLPLGCNEGVRSSDGKMVR